MVSANISYHIVSYFGPISNTLYFPSIDTGTFRNLSPMLFNAQTPTSLGVLIFTIADMPSTSTGAVPQSVPHVILSLYDFISGRLCEPIAMILLL